ncbi:tetratricopeptide repeat protein [Streptomyces sp. RS10V-4]|uniref:BTAD domain-containing putative transcriptional regulator n=1 Tax=Streptomyces rhizoryzae TaxID=2932493 RepID=UPI0020041F19|nr:BTAD domain-containing putative transcriptional regulator [Streptomyces rhizoryzae]MCK7626481.1 tetratricopeptide repeat protein [Streptomyces rhizoryzae]
MVSVRFRLLGGIEVLTEGRAVDVGHLRQRCVLAVLLVDVGRPVSVDRLIDRVWADRPPQRVRDALYSYLSRLRRALTHVPGTEIERRSDGYLLHTRRETIDLHHFRGLLARARAVTDDEQAMSRYEQALGLWHGEPFGSVDGLWFQQLRDALRQERLAAELDRNDRALRCGRHTALATELTARVEEHPLNERLAAQLMLALHRCGRPAEALAQYRRIHRALAKELGIAPGEHLHSLHQRLLASAPAAATVNTARTTADRGRPTGKSAPTTVDNSSPHVTAISSKSHAAADSSSPSTTAGSRNPHTIPDSTTPPSRPTPPSSRNAPRPGTDDTSPHHPPHRIPHQLPPTTPHLTGRAAELAFLDGRLAAARAPGSTPLVTLSGPAGVGKTTLALHWSHRAKHHFPDGQLYIDLRGFSPGAPLPPAEATHRFLEALGTRPGTIPTDPTARSARFRTLVDGRRLLLVLDNAYDTDQVRPLLPGSAHCLVLVTSRRHLTGLAVHHEARPLALDVLSTQAAGELLTGRLGPDRARAEPEALAELVEHCGRLPLALGIVAARATTSPDLPLSTLVAELRDTRHRLAALSTGDGRDTDLASVFSWSYRALSPAAARLFRLLAEHPGPDTTAAAATASAGLPPDHLCKLLAELVDAHLVQRRPAGRYQMHDLVRAYATGRLAADEPEPDRRAARRRLFDHYLHSALTADRLLDEHRDPVPVDAPARGAGPCEFTGPEQAQTWLLAEQAVLVAAVDDADRGGPAGHTWRLAWALAPHLQRTGAWTQWARVQRTALAAATRTGDATGQAHAAHGLGLACAWTGQHAEAHTHLAAALTAYTDLGDLRGQAHTHRTLAWLAQQQNRPADARHHAVRTLHCYTRAGFLPGQASALNAIGWYQALLGRHRQALSACGRALRLFEQVGNTTGQAHSWDSLAYAHRGLGRYQDAIACYDQALRLFRMPGDRYHSAASLAGLGDIHHATGDLPAARTAYGQALAILEELDHPEVKEVRERLRSADSRNAQGSPKTGQPG